LLQRLALRVLDESFAALDPETLERVPGGILSQAEASLVIVHLDAVKDAVDVDRERHDVGLRLLW
jgi:hypothetical protein